MNSDSPLRLRQAETVEVDEDVHSRAWIYRAEQTAPALLSVMPRPAKPPDKTADADASFMAVLDFAQLLSDRFAVEGWHPPAFLLTHPGTAEGFQLFNDTLARIRHISAVYPTTSMALAADIHTLGSGVTAAHRSGAGIGVLAPRLNRPLLPGMFTEFGIADPTADHRVTTYPDFGAISRDHLQSAARLLDLPTNPGSRARAHRGVRVWRGQGRSGPRRPRH